MVINPENIKCRKFDEKGDKEKNEDKTKEDKDKTPSLPPVSYFSLVSVHQQSGPINSFANTCLSALINNPLLLLLQRFHFLFKLVIKSTSFSGSFSFATLMDLRSSCSLSQA